MHRRERSCDNEDDEGIRARSWVPYSRLSPVFWVTLTLTLIYGALAGARLKGPSADNHYAYLAQSWLHGQLHLSDPPPHKNDWASYEVLTIQSKAGSTEELRGVRRGADFVTLKGEKRAYRDLKVERRERRYFVSFPPLPAVLMLPFVWVMGLKAPDTWLTLLFAVLNGALCYRLVSELRRRGWLRGEQPRRELWLVSLMCLGSAHLWCAVLGQVWYTALIIGVSFHLLYLRATLDTSRPLRAGLYLGLAFSTRPTLVLLSFIFYGQLLPTQGQRLSAQERLRRATLFSIPPLVIGLLLMWHNEARFGSLFEFGHSYLAGGQLKRISEYGLFHWVFLKKNLIAAFALLPLAHTQLPALTLSMHGMAIQASSPGLLWALRPGRAVGLEARTVSRLTSLSACLILSLLLLYQNTGWVQFSWRFILDLLPSLVLLIAVRVERVGFWFKLCVVWGVVVNLIGALSFGRHGGWFEYVDLPALLPH